MAGKLLYTVKQSNGSSSAILLSSDATLADIRKQLTQEQCISDADSFMLNNAPVKREQESEILLSVLVPTGQTITLGTSSVELGPGDPERSIMTYRQLSQAQKQDLFAKIQVTKGLLIDDNGFNRSFKDVVSWGSNMPAESEPRVVAQVISDYSFNKTTFDLKTTGVEKVSVSVSSPYGSAQAEYEHEKTKTTSKSSVTEYLLSKYIVRKMALNMDLANMTVAPGFVSAVTKAVTGYEDSIDGYSNLLTELATWGYYVAGNFTLGGVLYSTEKTAITDFSQAETEKTAFSASFKAEFKSIGGGAAYSNAQGSEQTNTTSSKYKDTTLIQVGGVPGTDNDYTKWMRSLDSAVNWDAASYELIIPSIALLWSANATLASTCVKLINKFYSYGAVQDRQPFLSMSDYATQVQTYYQSPY